MNIHLWIYMPVIQWHSCRVYKDTHNGGGQALSEHTVHSVHTVVSLHCNLQYISYKTYITPHHTHQGTHGTDH
jgi:hypothetical protein